MHDVLLVPQDVLNLLIDIGAAHKAVNKDLITNEPVYCIQFDSAGNFVKEKTYSGLFVLVTSNPKDLELILGDFEKRAGRSDSYLTKFSLN